VHVVRGGHSNARVEFVVARLATVLLGVVSVVLGIAFKGQNVAYMVGLAFAIAASANFPALVLAIFWRRLTTAGAQWSMLVGTVSTLLLIYLSPAIQVISSGRLALFSCAIGIVTIHVIAVAILVSREACADEARLHLERRLHLGVD
jgi:cation/acetate symporter